MFLHFRVCKLSLEFFTWVFLHSTKVQALEHELAGVKEDRKRLEEGGSHNLTIIDEVRNWGGTEKWVRAVCARALLCATLRGPAGTLSVAAEAGTGLFRVSVALHAAPARGLQPASWIV